MFTKNTLLLFFFFGFVISIQAQEKTFRFQPLAAPMPSPQYTTEIDGIHWGKVKFADIDNDGDQDITLIGGSRSGDAIARFYLNDGNGNFYRSRRNLSYGHIRCDFDYADIDNDNDLDLLISGYSSSSNTRLYRNNGKGDFNSLPFTFFTSLRYSSVAFADVDNDMDQDFIIAGEGTFSQEKTELYLNDGFGNYSLDTNNYFEPIKEGDFKFIDLDNDNDLDLLLSGLTATNGYVTQIYYNDSIGNFSLDTINQLQGFKDCSLDLGDLDGDQDIDFIITGKGSSSRQTNLYLNNGQGKMILQTNTGITNMSSGYLKLADLDSDGDLDLILSGSNSSSYGSYSTELYLNNGSGSFTLVKGTPFIPVYLSSIDAADIDGDLDLDVIICGLDKNNRSLTQLYINDGNAQFKAVTSNSFPGYVHTNHSFGDIDQDGDPDLVILGNDGRWAKTQFYEMDSAGNYKLSTQNLQGLERGDVVFEDFDNDLKLDLFMSGNINQYSGANYYYKNDSNNVFTNQTHGIKAKLYGNISTGDIDQDNDMDILIAGKSYYPAVYSTGLYRNDSGAFTTEINTPFDTGNYVKTALKDLNNDGRLDVITFGQDSLNKPLNQVFLNQNGSFVEVFKNQFPRIYISTYALEDINGDSLYDLFIAGADSAMNSYAYLYLNNGNGSFRKDTINQFQGFRNGSVVFADFDQDNDLDLVTNGSVGIGGHYPKTSIYRNDSGKFISVENIDLEVVQEGEVSVADIDNDGYPDILLTGNNELNENITRLYRNVSCYDSYTTDSIISCDSIVWIDGITYDTSTTTPTYRLTNMDGCDSIVTLHLKVISDTIAIENVSRCGSYKWSTNKQTYYQSGIYFDTLQNRFSCDSIIKLNLQIQPYPYDSNYVVSCDSSYKWLRTGQTFYQSGRYFDTTANSIGCDSVNGLILYMDTTELVVSSKRDTLTATGSYVTYQWLDCVNQLQAISGADSMVFISGRNGSFAVEAYDGACYDTSTCVSVVITDVIAIPKDVLNDIRIFPNPFKSKITIQWEKFQPELVEIYNINGQLMYRKNISNSNAHVQNMSINISTGMYIVRIKVNGQSYYEKIIRE